MTLALITLVGLVGFGYWWMDAKYKKYENHQDRHLWMRSNEQILAEIEAEDLRIEAENAKNVD